MNRLRIARNILRTHWTIWARWAVSVVSLVLGTLGLGKAFHDNPLQAAILRLPLLILSAVFLVSGIRAFYMAWVGIRSHPEPVRAWEYAGPYAAWPRIGAGKTQAAYSPELNRRLAAEEDIRVTVDGDWLPEGKASTRRKRIVGGLAINEGKYRLATDLLEEDYQTVTLQKTDYASFLATNRLAYESWWNSRDDASDLDLFDIEPTLRRGILPSLRNSNSSNHLGGDILAVGDGFTFLQLQNAKSGMYPNMWVGSASGSFDIGDLTPTHRLQDLVKTGLLRELTQELKLAPRDVPTLDETKVIGYSRATYLGGKPQFYGVCRIARIRPGQDRYAARILRLDFEGKASGLLAALEEFAEDHEGLLAPPLQMLIQLVREWLTTDPNAASWLWPAPGVPTPEPSPAG